jgi:hypothetical protein
LHFTPPDPIGVVLYTQQSFRDAIDPPVWAGAGNDGRIRVPAEGLASVSAQLSRTLKHELAHSFVWQKTLGRCPVWLDEGLAQWFEGRRSADAVALVGLYDRGQYIPLQRLELNWNTMSSDQARFAYAWSLAAVESIISNSSMWALTVCSGDSMSIRILKRRSAGRCRPITPTSSGKRLHTFRQTYGQ